MRIIGIAALMICSALPALARPGGQTPRAPVYDCWVLEADGGDYITVGIARDDLMVYRQRFLTPANLDALKSLCRAEIAKFTMKDDKPITVGKVDLTVPVVEPPPPPTPAEIAERAFLAKVDKLRRLKTVLDPANADVVALEAEIALELKAHPEHLDLI